MPFTAISPPRPADTPGIRAWVKPYGNAISRPGKVCSLAGLVCTTRRPRG
jgi:hypothetical protein